MSEHDSNDIILMSKEEAIAEVRRWLEVEQVDPEGVFAAMGDQVIRYKDLTDILEQETPDGNLLRFAITRGQSMRQERRQAPQNLVQIAPTPRMPKGSGEPPASESSGNTPPTA